MFKIALKEIQAGKKVSHYMWYIFPQIKGLGESFTSKHYAINDLAQANAFMQQGDLFKNLLIISEALLSDRLHTVACIVPGIYRNCGKLV